MTLMMKSCFLSLTILFLWRVADVAEACKCIPVNIQQGYCRSDVVFSARVTGKEVINTGNGPLGNSFKNIKYDIQVTKVYKGPDFNIDAVYTSSSSATCGATLDTGDKLYLITGKLEDDGTVQISRCNFIELYDDLNIAQRLKLFQCYTGGCGC
ncbi:metalloproteinase inhibitor 2-like [Nematolebias whitei]|uniref:metalloproteinase inhibitor 2-like n=1 Tax=Nematolebias whitei TaxID=451745 RepID=UPI001896E562|nr:metalloproteinase inhibitor 2-like [Nematolebias whitei]